MKKYLVILRDVKALDSFKTLMRFNNVDYEHLKNLQYHIYTDENTANKLNKFDWIAVIKTN